MVSKQLEDCKRATTKNKSNRRKRRLLNKGASVVDDSEKLEG